MVKKIESSGEFESTIKSSNLTVVDFYADWCGPCKRIAPFIEGLASKFPDVTFVKVDVDGLQEVAQQQGISAMPTFKFFVAGECVDTLRGADPNGLEAKVLEHKGKGGVTPFSGSGHTLVSETGAGAPPMNARDARLKKLGALYPGSGDGTQMIDKKSSNTAMDVEDEDADLAKAIAASLSDTNNSATEKIEDKKSVFTTSEQDAQDTKDAEKAFAEQEEKDLVDGEELVPLPVDEGILKELLDMGFSDTRARKGIYYGKTLDGAVSWISENENDPSIDEAFMVKKSDAIPKKPLTEEEKAVKMKELKELAAHRRREREAAEKSTAIQREKERRERGQNMAETQEQREKMQRERERAKLKKEKADAAAEKKRLLEEIKRDKAIRAANKGVLPSVLGVDGYNPSAVQYEKAAEPASDQEKAVVPAVPSATAGASAAVDTGAPKESKSVTGAIVPGATIANPTSAIDSAISTISKYRTSGDGGNALKLLLTFVGNVHKNPTDPKFRSINTESNAFKNKLAGLVGPVTLLRALGFEKTDDGKMKLEGDTTLPLLASTFSKLTEAEAAYWKANPQ